MNYPYVAFSYENFHYDLNEIEKWFQDFNGDKSKIFLMTTDKDICESVYYKLK